MSMVLAYGKNMKELHESYTKQINEMIFDLLENLEYEVERTNDGAKKLMTKLKNEGKKITITETNRRLTAGKLNICYSCDVEIKLLGGE